MEQFEYNRALSVPDAVHAALSETARFIAGGTTLLDLMKLNVERPSTLVDINRLPLEKVEKMSDGSLKVGALVRNADLAHHPEVVNRYAVLSQALLSGASAQLRNMATTGGNLLQRTRCVYFRDPGLSAAGQACNKRQPGSGCAAIGGHNRMLAIMGVSDFCIATNPSDMNVALTALEATIHITGSKGERAVSIQDFFVLPGSTPHIENVLSRGDLVTHISVAPPAPGTKSVYLKLRDRASYEFALSSAAVVIKTEGTTIQRVRIAMGGIGTKPWRCLEAERALIGRQASPETFAAAAAAELQHAKPQSENGFKVELAKRCLRHALKQAVEKV